MELIAFRVRLRPRESASWTLAFDHVSLKNCPQFASDPKKYILLQSHLISIAQWLRGYGARRSVPKSSMALNSLSMDPDLKFVSSQAQNQVWKHNELQIIFIDELD